MSVKEHEYICVCRVKYFLFPTESEVSRNAQNNSESFGSHCTTAPAKTFS